VKEASWLSNWWFWLKYDWIDSSWKRWAWLAHRLPRPLIAQCLNRAVRETLRGSEQPYTITYQQMFNRWQGKE
jgi:hypothetical protein